MNLPAVRTRINAFSHFVSWKHWSIETLRLSTMQRKANHYARAAVVHSYKVHSILPILASLVPKKKLSN